MTFYAEDVKAVSKKYGVSLSTAKQYLEAEHKRNILLNNIVCATNLDDLKEVLETVVRDTYPTFTNKRPLA